jgi:glycerophosphoryl diester phosphodiesterase
MTLAEAQELDAAHRFVPGRSAVPDLPADSYPLRGARHGDTDVPGHEPEDFRIPSLAEVFDVFPETPMIIEIKGTADDDLDSYLRTGRLLAEFLNTSGRPDIIVASFKDDAISDFHDHAPQIGTAPGMSGVARYFLLGVKPPAHTVALHIPVRYQGIPVATRWFVQRAHRDGYAVHVWFSGTAPDTAETYREVLRSGPDGMMPAEPSVLEEVLAEEVAERPPG